jgi:putative endonuclease
MFANELRRIKPTTSNHPTKWSAPIPPGGKWLCYILCCADGTLYTGITNDLAKRLRAHNSGSASKYTRGRAPVELMFVECCADKPSALKREMEIKSLLRTEKLALIESAMR